MNAGATRHMTNTIDLLTNVSRTDTSVEIGDGSVFRVHSIETLETKAGIEGETRNIYINYVAFDKELTTNILPVSCIQRNMEVSFKSD